MERNVLRRSAAAAAAIAAVGVIAGTANAATVRTTGGFGFEPNEFIRDTTRWAPGHIVVRRNERVVWIDRDRAPDPHTITIAAKRTIPSTADTLFECRACALANAHLEDPSNPDSDLATTRLNRGRPGLNQPGDSLVLVPGGRISARVTAAVGRRLHYVCAIHPWMQGSITVARAGAGGGAALAGRHQH